MRTNTSGHRGLGLLILILAIFGPLYAHAQTTLTSTGNPQNTAQFPIESGFINLGSGDLHLEIPIANTPQRGDLSLPMTLVYDSSIWQIGNGLGSLTWAPTGGGWSLNYGTSSGADANIQSDICPENSSSTVYVYSAIQWTDMHGTVRTFPLKTIQANGCTDSSYPDTPSSQGFATDASGYFAQLSNYNSLSVWDPSGALVVNATVPSVAGSAQIQVDRNGNEISFGIDGTVLSDTMGHTPIKETVGETDSNGAPVVLYLDVPTTGTQTARYTVTYKTVSVDTKFGIDISSEPVAESTASIRVISSLGLPDGSSYSFGYDDACPSGSCGAAPGQQPPAVAYGLLNSITLPHGGTVSYSYNSDANAGTTEPARWVSSYSGGSGGTSFAYAYQGAYSPTSETGGYSCSKISNTASGVLLTSTYIFSDCNGAIEPMKIVASPTANPNTVDSFTMLGYDFSQPCQNGACTGAQWINLTDTTTVLPSSGSVSSILAGSGGNGLITDTQVGYAGQGSGRVTSTKQWDYYSGTYSTSLPDSPPGNPKRETDTAYNYTVNNALYPTDISTKDSTGSVVSEVQYTYDQAAYFVASPAGVPSHNNSLAATNRGNATTVSQVPHGGGSTTPIPVHTKYDDAGSVVATTDGNSNVTSISYDPTDTFPQLITLPSTAGSGASPVAHTVQSVKDFNTGQILSQTDQNGQTTSYQYDSIGRLSTVQFSNGGTPVTLETVSYPNANETDISTLQVQNADTTASIPSSTILDGYGRISQATQAGISSETTYNAQGLVQNVTNPHTSTQQSTDGKSIYSYDELGRVTTATMPNGHSTIYSYTLNTVTVTDALQHVHQQTYDVFGNITSVLEPDNNGNLTWLTNYQRTDLGAMKEIDQEGGSSDPAQWRSRYFTFDGFGRLATATTPEAGQFSYTYDNNGNPLTATNQNTTANTVTNTYDALNRVLTKQVGGGPTYSYTYDAQDQSGDQYGIGRLTSTSDGGTVGARYTHDPTGRVNSEADCRPSDCSYSYKTSANFDFMGNILALVYPDSRKVEWVYDLTNHATEEVNTFWGTDEVAVPYTAYGTYFPTGQLQDIFDGSGVEVTTNVDPDGNLTSLTYNNNGTPLLARTYTWANNAANLLGVIDTASGRTQSYTYDQLNRLLTANDTGTTSAGTNPGLPTVPASSTSFSYDPWGNLGQTGPYSFSQSFAPNNQISGSGYGYDLAGNLTGDGFNHYSYRADGHQVSSNGTTYSYDPLDQRVVKSGGPTTEYFYFGGTLLATRDASSGAWNDFLYGPTGLLGEVAGTESANPTYRVGDQLDTLVQTTDDNGNVLGGVTIQPFGQILSNTTSDNFILTDHEQDPENSSVYTTFRQYSAAQGRWLTPDPYSGSYDLSNPQSFNRYTYTLNSPATLADPLGLQSTGGSGSDCSLYLVLCNPILTGIGSGSGGGSGSGDGGGGFGIGAQHGLTITQGNGSQNPAHLRNPSGISQRANYSYTAPGANGNGTASANIPGVRSCVNANFAQRAVVSGLSRLARSSNKTVGYGAGGSLGAGGLGPFGFNFAISQQLLVSPDGTAGLATTYTKQLFSVASKGFGGLAGVQFAFSTAKTFTDNAGLSIDAGVLIADELGGGLDVTNSGATVTLGGGFGGRGHAGTFTYTLATPFCSVP